MSEPQRMRRGRRGGAGGGGREKGAITQSAWRMPANPFAPFQIVSDDQIEAIHQASLRVLAEQGMEVLHEPARALLKREGATVEGDNVLFDPAMIEEKVATAPDHVTLHARNPARNVTIAPGNICNAAVGGPAFTTDLDRGRRNANFEDMKNFSRLIQMLDVIHMEGGGAVEPTDLPAETRHLDMYQAFITLTDKAWTGYALGAVRADDGIDMAAIALGTDRAGLLERPAILTVINSNSPRRLDGPMSEGLMAYAEAGQPFAATPFTLAGAMAPATIAGASVQQNAEALAMITLAQCVRPGTPVIYGGFTSNVDMKTGAPAFGTPEYAQAVLIGCQLARRHGVPYRTSNVTSSNAPDAQAAWESMMSLWGAVMGHANLIKHGAGWMEGGLTASFEKMILDADLLQMMAEFMIPIQVDESTIGLDAIAEAGPGGHFFGTAHTLERYETAFYEPILSDWSNFESWTEAGSATATERANRVWKQLLEEYEAPPIDAAIEDELKAFVEQRKGEIRKAA
ncbi:MAG: trimethylamine methyltransferase family protein [Rhodospirillaceae bacterium]|nr:trimethylamine methyltransferase family protein [Rhodospirillaceae bacterium]